MLSMDQVGQDKYAMNLPTGVNRKQEIYALSLFVSHEYRKTMPTWGCMFTPSWWRHQMETFSALLDSPYKGQWRGALMFPLICAWTNGWANKGDTGDLRRHRAHYDVTVMVSKNLLTFCTPKYRCYKKNPTVISAANCVDKSVKF